MDESAVNGVGTDESRRVFVARQPILDRHQRVTAYELLFRGSAEAGLAEISDPSLATARVAIDALLSMGLSDVLGPHKGFLNVDLEMLASEAIEVLPVERFVLEVLETVPPWALERCRELKDLGFEIALDDFVPQDSRKELLDVADYVKVDLTLTDPASLSGLVSDLRRSDVRLLAEKVETNEEFENCMDLGFELFQGYFFSKPTTLLGNKLEPHRIGLMSAFRAVSEEQTSDTLEEIFKRDATLGVQLLRIANSAALASVNKITSFEHAIMYIGRRQLRRWILLMLYASNDSVPAARAIIEVAAVRGRMLEMMAPLIASGAASDSAINDRAFLVGMLSLSDSILGVPCNDLIKELALEPEVGEAILGYSGPLGDLLRVAEAVEGGRFVELAGLLESLGLSSEQLGNALSEAYVWYRQLDGGDTLTSTERADHDVA